VMEQPTYCFRMWDYTAFIVDDMRCRGGSNECVYSCRVMSRHGRGMV
jgi:hypothetical protein